jgi:subtilisin family serine protease
MTWLSGFYRSLVALVLAFSLGACGLTLSPESPSEGTSSIPRVYQGQVVVEAKGPWHPWGPNIAGPTPLYPAGRYLVDSAGIASLGADTPIIPYDAATDPCNYIKAPGIVCEPNFVIQAQVEPNDPLLSQLYGLKMIEADKAWGIVTKTTARVAVLDSGIDKNHPDLIGNSITSHNFIGGEPDEDTNGHGTHVAGTIAATGNNGVGVVGVSWRSPRLLALRFLNKLGSGSLFNAIRAIDYAIAQRDVRVNNASWGCRNCYSQQLRDAIRRAKDANILFVAAAGNNGLNTDLDGNAHYPSMYEEDNVISVAAVDADKNLTSFSNYGALSVDIAAPGKSIVSTATGGGVRSLSGTSMAAPHISGIAALVWTKHPSLDVVAIRERILTYSQRVNGLGGKVSSGAIANAFGAITGATPVPEPPKCQKAKLRKCNLRCQKKYRCKCLKQQRCRTLCREKTNCPNV